jgi:hypothetical protein
METDRETLRCNLINVWANLHPPSRQIAFSAHCNQSFRNELFSN